MIFAMIWICLLTLLIAQVYSTQTYVGCFYASFVHSNDYFQVQHPLPAQECLGVCDNRLTRYAGLRSTSSHDYCFCGNDLLERSTRVDNSTCVPCSDAPWTCGTNLTVALYKLRDSTPVAVLLATDNGVQMFKENSTTTIISETQSVHWVDFSYTEDVIFYRQDKKILRSSYNYLMFKHGKRKEIYEKSERIDELAVDWIRKKLFFVYYQPDQIEGVGFAGGDLKMVYDNNYIITDLHVDPYFGALFFIDSTHDLHSFLLQNNTLLHYDQSKLHYYSARKIALDIHEQVVYLIVQLDVNSPLYIVSTEYGDTKTPTVLFSGPELTNARALDVFHGDIYWVNYIDNDDNMYRCRLTPRCKEENLIMMYQSTSVIFDIRVFHPYKQTRYYEEVIIEPYRTSREDIPTTKFEKSQSSTPSSNQQTTRDKEDISNNITKSHVEVKPTSINQLYNKDEHTGFSIYYIIIVIGIGLMIIIILAVFVQVNMYVKLITHLNKLTRQQANIGSIPLQDVSSQNTYVEINDVQRKSCSELD